MVKLCLRNRISNGLPYALKIISKLWVVKDEHICKFILKFLLNFIVLKYTLVNEKEILNLWSEWKFIVTLHETFQDETNLYFVLEYLPGGELGNILNKHRAHVTINEILVYLAEILIGLEYLHNLNIVYRDLKLENIVLNKLGHIKLVDFGFSKIMSSRKRTFTQWGTEGYVAPEILNNFGHDWSCDIYSFGILILTMIAGYVPNTESKIKKTLKLLGLNYDAKDLITQCLNNYPDQRPTVKKIMNHSIFQDIDWSKVKEQGYQPFLIPELDDDFDLKYFQNSTLKTNHGFYLKQTKEFNVDLENEVASLNKNEKVSVGNIHKSSELKSQRCMPLGNFQIYRINNSLKDF